VEYFVRVVLVLRPHHPYELYVIPNGSAFSSD
jgi:hypothetical protein